MALLNIVLCFLLSYLDLIGLQESVTANSGNHKNSRFSKIAIIYPIQKRMTSKCDCKPYRTLHILNE